MVFVSGEFCWGDMESYWTRYSHDDWNSFDIASDIADWSSRAKFKPAGVLFDQRLYDLSMGVAVCNIMPEPFVGQKSMPYEYVMAVKYLAFALN